MDRLTYSTIPITTSQDRGSPPSLTADRLAEADPYIAQKLGRSLTAAERRELLADWEQEARQQCGTCNGTTWMQDDDRRTIRCSICQGPEPLNRRLVVAGFLPGETPPRLADFQPDRQPKGAARSQAKRAANATVQWVKNEGAPTLLLAGKTGVGKSHLATGAAHELCNRRVDVLVFSGSICAAYLRRFEDGTADWFRRRSRTCGFLVIDDIGAAGHDPSGYLLSEYEALIDERYRMARRTLVTTNLSESDLMLVIGPRAVSRLFDRTRSAQVLMNDCMDLRKVEGA